MNTSLQIKNLTRDDILTHLDALAAILENCVSGVASVSFMLPFSLDKARSFWRGIAESVGRNERLVLACVDPQDGVIKSVDEIDAVGHRVLHGGDKFVESCIIDEACKQAIRY